MTSPSKSAKELHVAVSILQNNTQLVKKFRAFYVSQNVIATLSTARHWIPSWDICIQSTPSYRIYLKLTLILFSHPHIISSPIELHIQPIISLMMCKSKLLHSR
jgi:hypothetical protein